MANLRLRFYQELNDFLPATLRGREFEHSVKGTPSVKDVIEALGVPHTEVDLILVNGRSVDFTCLLQDGDRVSVFPVFESLDIRPAIRLRPEPLRNPRFVLDAHLGRLAAYLRLLGFDSLYSPEADDAWLAEVSVREERTLLTRDRGLLKRKAVTRGYCPRQTHPRQQVVEVLRRFDLLGCARPFTRCMACNGVLERVGREVVAGSVPADVVQMYDDFTRCTACGKVYWRGSHFARLQALVEAVRRELDQQDGFRSLGTSEAVD